MGEKAPASPVHPEDARAGNANTAYVLCLFCYSLMLRRRLSPNFVAERRATTPFLI